jgi:hypothetical protein
VKIPPPNHISVNSTNSSFSIPHTLKAIEFNLPPSITYTLKAIEDKFSEYNEMWLKEVKLFLPKIVF